MGEFCYCNGFRSSKEERERGSAGMGKHAALMTPHKLE